MAPPPSEVEAQARGGGDGGWMEGEEAEGGWKRRKSAKRQEDREDTTTKGAREEVVNDVIARRDANAKAPPSPSFSLAEIARHDMPDDCWLIIRGKVYDVTSWVPRHPGGSLIHVRAGKDCTHLFDSYHPLYVRRMLDKYCIGEVERREEEVSRRKRELLEYGDDSQPEEFYTVVKKRVEAHLREKKINPRVSAAMYIKSVVILLGYFLCYYGAFFFFTESNPFFAPLLCAIGMGFLAAEVGVSIQHDCNHGAYATWQPICYLLGASLDIVGASSFMWKQQHVVGHHQYTNVDDFDPDIRVKDPDVRRVTTKQPWRGYQSYQHVYLGFLYGLLSLKSVFLDDFNAYFSGRIGNLKISRMTTSETFVFFGGKLVYAIYMLVFPALFSSQSTGRWLVLYVISMLICGWTLAFLFQVAHVVEEAQFPEADRSGDGSKVGMGWAAAQAATSTGFSHGSMFWTHVSGGLNYQLEHHLFPGMCHLHYPTIQPIVAATCREFAVPYHAYPSFWAALQAHFAWLRKVGIQGMEWRLAG